MSLKTRHIALMLSGLLFGGFYTMAPSSDNLKAYRKKRDFTKTPEPSGGKVSPHQQLKFVIHKHDASHLHFDLRLEIDGALPSWAVPKGPSLNPAIKRLAIMTEVHPLEYLEFEGVIPEGEYGAGTVMVWDIGTYRNIKMVNGKVRPMSESIKHGHIEVFLEGQKLQGAFSLVRMHGKDDQWLLVKMQDEYASARANPVNTKNKSALTGRTMTQIKKDAKVKNKRL